MTTLRLGDVANLPAVLTTAQLAEVTGTDERAWWAVGRGEDESPIEDLVPLRVGKRGVLRWPTMPVLRALRLVGDGVNTPRDAESSTDPAG